jgi:putative transcriptional regulator
LDDPNFSRSVILLIKHDEDGSVGFVLNDVADFRIGEVLSDFPIPDAPVYLGGPVGKQHLFVMHNLPDNIPQSIKITDNLYWGGDFDHIHDLASEGIVTRENTKFFAGYSGWSSSQLMREVSENSWITTRLPEALIMSHQVSQLWQKALRGMGDTYHILSNFPKDPALN